MLTTSDIRRKFLEFFAAKGHSVIKSDSLVPKNDPTVLFTTAGMQQFKRQFLGHIEGYTRAASSQKCLRTDDLEQVGETNFHHTFFEMLGNFSFGDYFKKEAIAWAWEFLTEILQLPPDKLWVSIYKDDTEAEKIWLKGIKIPPERFVKLGDKSNFWPSNAKLDGPNGPCGPCSEIFYDYGPNPQCTNSNCNPECDCGRFAEIWNLVFTQFNRKDGGELEPLPAKNIDTGMGLERLAAVLQGKPSNFDTDIFLPIRETIRQHISGELTRKEECIIADHARAIVIAICDGIIPSNKERGSVIKRLITDSANIALSYGPQEPRIYRLVPVVVDVMKDQYPELIEKAENMAELIKKTEEAFIQVRALRIPELEALNLSQMSDQQRGEVYFKFRDTYGLPLSVILATARKKGIKEEDIQKDLQVYSRLMQEQKDRSRAASKMMGDVFTDTELNLNVAKTKFSGYEEERTTSRILKLFVNHTEQDSVQKGEAVQCILDETPFYAESGGQIGDTGTLTGPNGTIQITDTQKISDIFIHEGKVLDGTVSAGDRVEAGIDMERRLSVMRNHTATHLLQAALRQVLGSHVQQQGSSVDQEKLRFDFSHPKALTAEEIREIEDIVNSLVLRCDTVTKESMSLDEAKSKGALAFFAEKYADTVRVVSISDYSTELCGGTHLDSTGQIGLFKIINESAIAQGIRRIEARTGRRAYQLIMEQEDQMKRMAQLLKAPLNEIVDRTSVQLQRMKQLEKDIEKYQFETIKQTIPQLIDQAVLLDGIHIVRNTFENVSMSVLRKLADTIKQRVSAVIVLGSQSKTDAQILVAVSQELTKNGWHAKDIIQIMARKIQGSGGGRDQMAQAGSKHPELLSAAMQEAENFVKAKTSHSE